MALDFDARTVETVQDQEVRVDQFAGPPTVGEKHGRCEHCKCSILTVKFRDREPQWFHTNTRFRICQGGATEASPVTE